MPQRKAHQVPSLGESPAQARERMKAEGTVEGPPFVPEGRALVGVEVAGNLTAAQVAEIHAKEGGFQGDAVSGGITEERGDRPDLPSPSRAMDMIRQLSNDKNTLTAERDAAINLVERYRAQFGDID